MLDFAFAQRGDGPAFFVIFAVSPIIVLLAFITEALFHPAPWMHLVLWMPTIIILSLVLLRPLGGPSGAAVPPAGRGKPDAERASHDDEAL